MALKKPYAAGKVAVNRPLELGRQADVGTPMEQRLLTSTVLTAHSIYEGYVLAESKANMQGTPSLGTALTYLDAQMQQMAQY